jgi:ribulose-bisphosphate carboxylase large chain
MNDSPHPPNLDPKQAAYVNPNLPNPANREYLLGVFRLVPGGKLNMLPTATDALNSKSSGPITIFLFFY